MTDPDGVTLGVVKLETKADLDSSDSMTLSPKVKGQRKQKVTVKKLHECDVCLEQFVRKWDYNRHVKTAHRDDTATVTSPKTHTCSECHKVFKTLVTLQRHQLTHGERSHHCEVCSKAYYTVFALKKHMKTHSDVTPKSPTLNSCGEHTEGTNSDADLTDVTTNGVKVEIIDDLHSNDTKKSTVKVKAQKRKAIGRPKGPQHHQCPICSKVFTQKAHLQEHVPIHGDARPHLCTVCGEAFKTKGVLFSHMYTHKEKSLECEVCGKAFNQSKKLKEHMRKHAAIKPYICHLCGKGFTVKSSLDSHLLRHSSVKPFTCSQCPKAFMTVREVTQHERVHTGERPFSCELCGKAFKQQTALVFHMRTHTGERPYQCDICGQKFRQRSALNDHVIGHNAPKTLQCTVCEARFTLGQHLRRHMKSHSDERPYKCAQCALAFKTSQALCRHRVTHTGRRPHVCEICGASFNRRAHYNGHMMIHQGLKNYKCQFCDRTFKLKTYMTCHQKRVHKQELSYISAKLQALSEPRHDVTRKNGIGSQPPLPMLPSDVPYVGASQPIHGTAADDSNHLSDTMHSYRMSLMYHQQVLSSSLMSHQSPSATVEPKDDEHGLTVNGTSLDSTATESPLGGTATEARLGNSSCGKQQSSIEVQGEKLNIATSSFKATDTNENLSGQYSHDDSGEFTDAYSDTEVTSSYDDNLVSNNEQQVPADIDKHEMKELDAKLSDVSDAQPLSAIIDGVPNDDAKAKPDLLLNTSQSADVYENRILMNCSKQGYEMDESKYSDDNAADMSLEEISERLSQPIVKQETIENNLQATKEPETDPQVPEIDPNSPETNLRRQEQKEVSHDVVKGEVTSYQCAVCLVVSENKRQLNKHMKTHKMARRFPCDLCDMTFKTSLSRIRHKRKTHPVARSYACNICDKTFKLASSRANHLLTHAGKLIHCDQCDKTFRRPDHLRAHMTKQHSVPSSPIACEECGKTFARKWCLTSHMRRHSSLKPYACEYCSKTYKSSGELTAHTRTHTGERPYMCHLCPKTFAQGMQLNVHLRTHTGEKPYQCDVCGRKFAQPSSLSEHMFTHTDSRPFTCTVCQAAFKTNRSLLRHMISHSAERPYTCDQCAMTFKARAGLKKHMITHSGDKAYKCDVCGQMFGRLCHYKNHLSIHDGQKRHKCEYCGQAFRLTTYLNCHQRRVHSELLAVAGVGMDQGVAHL